MYIEGDWFRLWRAMPPREVVEIMRGLRDAAHRRTLRISDMRRAFFEAATAALREKEENLK